MSYIINNKDFLHNICRTKSEKNFNKLIKGASDEQLLSIVEICYHILRGKLNLSRRHRFKLSKNGDYYRSLSRARTPFTAKNRIIQTGEGPALLGAIIAPVIGAIAQTLLDKALSSRNEVSEIP